MINVLDNVLLTVQEQKDMNALMDNGHVDRSMSCKLKNILYEMTREIGHYRKELVVRLRCSKMRFLEMVQILVIMSKNNNLITTDGKKGHWKSESYKGKSGELN